MFKYIITTLLLSSIAFAANDNTSDTDKEKQDRISKQLKIEMETEKKYAREQTFYNYDNYNFKGSEVNQESLKHIPNLEMDELDMDNVYD